MPAPARALVHQSLSGVRSPPAAPARLRTYDQPSSYAGVLGTSCTETPAASNTGMPALRPERWSIKAFSVSIVRPLRRRDYGHTINHQLMPGSWHFVHRDPGCKQHRNAVAPARALVHQSLSESVVRPLRRRDYGHTINHQAMPGSWALRAQRPRVQQTRNAGAPARALVRQSLFGVHSPPAAPARLRTYDQPSTYAGVLALRAQRPRLPANQECRRSGQSVGPSKPFRVRSPPAAPSRLRTYDQPSSYAGVLGTSCTETPAASNTGIPALHPEASGGIPAKAP
jgi:hypothetical protein